MVGQLFVRRMRIGRQQKRWTSLLYMCLPPTRSRICFAESSHFIASPIKSVCGRNSFLLNDMVMRQDLWGVFNYQISSNNYAKQIDQVDIENRAEQTPEYTIKIVPLPHSQTNLLNWLWVNNLYGCSFSLRLLLLWAIIILTNSNIKYVKLRKTLFTWLKWSKMRQNERHCSNWLGTDEWMDGCWMCAAVLVRSSSSSHNLLSALIFNRPNLFNNFQWVMFLSAFPLGIKAYFSDINSFNPQFIGETWILH